MMMVLTPGQCGLVSRDSTIEVEPLDQSQALKKLDDAVDACDAYRAAARGDVIVEFLRGEATVVTRKTVDYSSPGST